jgi:membrane fusion protein (multidrug efflux system)
MKILHRFDIFNSLNTPDWTDDVRRHTVSAIAEWVPIHRNRSTRALQWGAIAAMVGACTVAAAQSGSAPSAPTSGIERREIRAQIKPIRSTLLSTEVPGTLNILKAEGARVKRGDVLLALDCSTFEAQLKKTEVEIQASEQQEQVQKRLFELNSSGQLEWEQAQFSTKRLRAEAGVLQSQIRKCTVQAPHAGVITEARSRSGQYAQAGQVLLELADDSAFEAEFLAPSAWVQRLRVGAALVLQVDELGASQSAAISRVADKVDPVSQSVKVTVRIQRPIAGLKAGMSGSVDTRSLQP